jgi:hypothetical protein
MSAHCFDQASAAIQLLPAESIALTIARAKIARGDEVPPNTTAMLVMALDRITGKSDWTEEAQS